MADDAGVADEAPVTFHIKSSGNAKYTLTLPLTTTALDLKNKLAGSEYANIPPESQRLIYSGRVLKDTDTLSSHKVKEGNTMHLVKSAASNQRQNPASQGNSSVGQAPNSTSSPAPAGVPSNLASGTGNNPLAGLTGARYAGFAQLPGAGMFGPDGGMGPPPDPERMVEMLGNPQFAQMMNEALQNPQVIDMMIQQNPQLRAMGPQARQLLQSDHFRRLMTDPEALRSMAHVQRAMGNLGMGSFGGAGSGQSEAFPAPGVTSTTASENREQTNAPGNPPGSNTADSMNPFSMFGGGSQGANPFMALFGPPGGQSQQPSAASPPAQTNANLGSNTQTGASTASDPSNQQDAQQNPFAALLNSGGLFGLPPQQNPSGTGSPQPQQQFNPFNMQNNPLMNNPELIRNMMQAMGGNNGSANPWANAFGGPGGMGSPPAPPDNRPPEERYADQLRQLNDMGFYDFDRNVQALSRSGGSVQGAIEHLLGGA